MNKKTYLAIENKQGLYFTGEMNSKLLWGALQDAKLYFGRDLVIVERLASVLGGEVVDVSFNLQNPLEKRVKE